MIYLTHALQRTFGVQQLCVTEQQFDVLDFVEDDGGRAAAGFRGRAGDCVTRAIAIVTGRPYLEIYRRLADGMATQRASRRKGKKAKRSARDGVSAHRKWFKDYMAELGFTWVSTMTIGAGCTTHLRANELPKGRIIARVSRHYCAVIDHVIHDTFNPSRQGQRCVYGYWAYQPTRSTP